MSTFMHDYTSIDVLLRAIKSREFQFMYSTVSGFSHYRQLMDDSEIIAKLADEVRGNDLSIIKLVDEVRYLLGKIIDTRYQHSDDTTIACLLYVLLKIKAPQFNKLAHETIRTSNLFWAYKVADLATIPEPPVDPLDTQPIINESLKARHLAAVERSKEYREKHGDPVDALAELAAPTDGAPTYAELQRMLDAALENLRAKCDECEALEAQLAASRQALALPDEPEPEPEQEYEASVIETIRLIVRGSDYNDPVYSEDHDTALLNECVMRRWVKAVRDPLSPSKAFYLPTEQGRIVAGRAGGV